eukprot:gene3946-4272_t
MPFKDFDSTLGFPGEGPGKQKKKGYDKAYYDRLRASYAERAFRTSGDDVVANVFVSAKRTVIEDITFGPLGGLQRGVSTASKGQRDPQLSHSISTNSLLAQKLAKGLRLQSITMRSCKVVGGDRDMHIQVLGMSAERAARILKWDDVFASNTTITVSISLGIKNTSSYKTSTWRQLYSGRCRTVVGKLQQRLASMCEIEGGLHVAGGHIRPQADQDAFDEQRQFREAAQQNAGAHNASSKKSISQQIKKLAGSDDIKNCPVKQEAELRVIQFNVHGIWARHAELTMLLDDVDADVLLLQETHLKPADEAPRFTGWTLLRRDRPDDSGDGGVAALIRDSANFTFQRVQDAPIAATDMYTDWLRVKIIPLSKPSAFLELVNLYIPPDKKNRYATGVWDPRFMPCSPNTLIFGDLNAHSLKWEPFRTSTLREGRGTKLRQWAQDVDFRVLNNGTVTFQQGSARTAPDLTLCHSQRAHEIKWTVLEDSGSDHYPICVDIPTHAAVLQERRPLRWSFKKADWEQFQKASDVRALSQLNDALCNLILTTAKEHIPRGRGRRNPKPWWNNDVQSIVRLRRAARRSAHKTAECHAKYVELCGNAKRVMQQARREHWRQYLTSLDTHTESRDLWRTVKVLDQTAPAARPNPVLILQGKEIVTNIDKAKVLTESYAAECHLGEESAFHRTVKSRVQQRFAQFEQESNLRALDAQGIRSSFCLQELRSALDSSKNGKAPGPDGVHLEMLKRLGAEGQQLLLTLCNLSWESNVVPQAWKQAVICPLHKAGKDPAFQKTWDGGILFKMLFDFKVHPGVVHWYQNFLSQREACVQWAGTKSDYHAMPQGLPQGTHNGPTLFSMFSNDLPADLMYADDACLVVSAKTVEQCLTQMNAKLLRISDWATKWRLPFNMDKTVATVFGNVDFSGTVNKRVVVNAKGVDFGAVVKDGQVLSVKDDSIAAKCGLHRAARICKINGDDDYSDILSQILKGQTKRFELEFVDALPVKLKGQTVLYAKCPTYLGVKFDEQLKFTGHVDKVIRKMEKRVKVLRALTGTSLGCGDKTLRSTYVAYVRSVAEFGAPAWRPFINKSDRERLEDRLPQELLEKSGLQQLPREVFQFHSTLAPWDARVNVEFRDSLTESFAKKDMDVDMQKELAIRTLTSLGNFDLELWTDGSAEDGVRNGGAGAVFVRQGRQICPPFSAPAGVLVSSYRAEQVAFRNALQKLISEDMLAAGEVVLMVTDSKSLVQRLQKGPVAQVDSISHETWSLLARLFPTDGGRRLVVQWVPSHCGLPMNDAADRAAQCGSKMPQAGMQLDFDTTMAVIKRTLL